MGLCPLNPQGGFTVDAAVVMQLFHDDGSGVEDNDEDAETVLLTSLVMINDEGGDVKRL